MSRLAYLASGVFLMALKYTTDAAIVYHFSGKIFVPFDYLYPLFARGRLFEGEHEEVLYLLLLLIALPFVWIGFSMTLRRAVAAGLSPWIAFGFFVPLVNYALMLALTMLPERPRSPRRPEHEIAETRLRSGMLGVAVSVGLALVMVAFSVYALGSYGAPLFLGVPLAMGAAAGYFHNRRVLRPSVEAFEVALVAVTLTAACLLLFALEGVVCIAMAFPIALVLAAFGAFVGREIAMGGARPPSRTAGTLLLLPLLAGLDAATASPERFEVTTAVEVDAPPDVVWRHVTSFPDIPEPTEWLFRTGIAYPVRARIDGSGVGATRRCEFSTGAFVEPITVWDPPRRLAFDVASQPDPLRELSPWPVVHAPHLDAPTFSSLHGEFRLSPIDGGARTRLEGTTQYSLEIRPFAYWRLWTDWLLHSIHARVLDHVARLAEAEGDLHGGE